MSNELVCRGEGFDSGGFKFILIDGKRHLGRHVAIFPELLDAAKSYVAALDQWENTNKAEKRVERAEAALRAAIAKATQP